MIIRKRPSAWRLFFVLRGSIVLKTAPQILATMLFAGLVGCLPAWSPTRMASSFART